MNKFVRILLKSLVALVVFTAIIGPVIGTKALQIVALIASSEGGGGGFPATSVTTAIAEKQDWKPVIRSVGNVVAVQGVTVTTEIPGKVVKIHFQSGTQVQEGELLVELDASSEQAQLNSAEASAALAKINVDRSRELFEKSAIAKSELDTAEARFSEANAAVANIKTIIAKKTIVAPFSGKLGIRQVNVGQFLGSGQPVVSLQSINPVYVDSYLPQQRLSEIKVGHNVAIDWNEGSSERMMGQVTAIASEVDASTRNILVRTTLSNDSEDLRPGMFVEAYFEQPESNEVVVVPSTSILYASFGNSVFVAVPAKEGEGLIAEQKFVRLGEARGDFIEIISGLDAGDSVVTTGGFKLRNGAPIIESNENALEYSTTPKPSDA